MPGFAGRLLLFVAIGGVLLAGLQQVSMRWPPNFTHVAELQRIEAVLDGADQLEVLVLGNSHANTFDWEIMGVRGTALGLPWNEALGVEQQVKTLLPQLPRLHTALVVVSPITFRWDNGLAGDSHYLFSRRLFHAAVPGLALVDGDWHSYVRGRAYWLVREDNWYRVMLGVAGRDPYTAERDRYYELRTDSVSASVLDEHAATRVANKTMLQAEMTARHPGLVEDGYQALSRAVGELRRRGVRVVLFTPPYYRRYVELYRQHPEWDETRALTLRLAREHGLEWHDFSASEISDDHTQFRDSDHLNYEGRKRFTRDFLETVCSGHTDDIRHLCGPR